MLSGSVSKERGIISTYGRNKAIVLLAQLLWVFISFRIKSNVPVSQDINQVYIGIKVPAMVLYILAVDPVIMLYFEEKIYGSYFVAVLITSIVSFYLKQDYIGCNLYISNFCYYGYCNV